MEDSLLRAIPQPARVRWGQIPAWCQRLIQICWILKSGHGQADLQMKERHKSTPLGQPDRVSTLHGSGGTQHSPRPGENIWGGYMLWLRLEVYARGKPSVKELCIRRKTLQQRCVPLETVGAKAIPRRGLPCSAIGRSALTTTSTVIETTSLFASPTANTCNVQYC